MERHAPSGKSELSLGGLSVLAFGCHHIAHMAPLRQPCTALFKGIGRKVSMGWPAKTITVL